MNERWLRLNSAYYMMLGRSQQSWRDGYQRRSTRQVFAAERLLRWMLHYPMFSPSANAGVEAGPGSSPADANAGRKAQV